MHANLNLKFKINTSLELCKKLTCKIALFEIENVGTLP